MVPEGFRVLQDIKLRRRLGRRLLSPSLLTQVLRFGDLLAIFLGASIVPLIRHDVVRFVETETYLILGVALLATNAFSLAGLYEESQLRRTGRQIRYVVALWAGAVALGLVVLFLTKVSSDVSRVWTLGWFLMTAAMLVALRLGLARAAAALRDVGFLLRRVLVIGHGPHGQAVLERLRGGDQDVHVLGYLEVSLDEPLRRDQTAWLDGFLRTTRIEEVVLALPWSATVRTAGLLGKLRTHPVAVNFLPGMDEAGGAGLPLRGVAWFGGSPALRLQERPLDERKYLLKSLEDRILGSLLLVGVAPLLAMIAIAVKLSSRGPVFFRQDRVGFHGERFRVFKFRSMYTDLCDRPGQGFVAHTTKDDPRITPLGRFLRKSSLDELPQLINVVLGDMSLVGPRPHAVAHDDHYGAVVNEYLARHRVKPGITGWAQVNGARGEIKDLHQMEQRIRYDLEYIERWSLGFDLWIMLRTVGLVTRDTKAY
jgi:putative colanic acid biosynthesis UDP-glucose lipid carrier transferase